METITRRPAKLGRSRLLYAINGTGSIRVVPGELVTIVTRDDVRTATGDRVHTATKLVDGVEYAVNLRPAGFEYVSA